VVSPPFQPANGGLHQGRAKGGPAGPCTKQGAADEGGVHLRTAAVVEPAAGKRATSAGWLVSASDVCAEGSETPRLQAAGKVPTVAALGSRAPRGSATKHTEQSTHQAAIWAALVYAGQCLAKGRKVTLTRCGERYRSEKPTHRAQGREHTTGGSRQRRNVGAAATETRGGETGREQPTGTSGRGPTRGPTSRGGGTTTAGRAQEAPRLPARN
jgi:hypothetical protein